VLARRRVAEGDHLACRDALIPDARSALLLGRKDALRVGHEALPELVEAAQAALSGFLSIRAWTSL
jgi:hypothetical protein